MQKGEGWIAYYKSDAQTGGLVLFYREQNGNILKINYRKISQKANGQSLGRDALAFLRRKKFCKGKEENGNMERILNMS